MFLPSLVLSRIDSSVDFVCLLVVLLVRIVREQRSTVAFELKADNFNLMDFSQI